MFRIDPAGCVRIALLLYATSFGASSLAQPEAPEKSKSTTHEAWLKDAKALLDELSGVIDGIPDDSRSLKHFTDWQNADRLIWKPWVVTGNPPKLEEGGKLKPLSRHHVEDYRLFLAEYGHLPEEDLRRRALISARKSFASPLCFATLQYLNQLTGSSVGPLIWVTPHRKILLFSPSETECQNLSATYDRWLVRNHSSVKWDSRRRQFRAGDGRAIDVTDLGIAVSDVRVHRFPPQ